MKSVVGIFALSCLFAGCSTTQQLASCADANRKVGGGTAMLHLRSGLAYEAEQIHVTQDSTMFINSENDSLVVLPTGVIKSFRLTHHGGGALEGLLFGGLGGVSIGLLAAENGGGGAAFYGGIIGGIGGAIVGGLKGHNYTFILPADSVGGHSKGLSIVETQVK